MAETWWTWEQAVTYVLAHYPCENRRIADGLLTSFVCGDTFPARWWRHVDNTMLRIEGLGRDWVIDRDFGRDPFDRFGNGEIVLEAAAVRRLCEPTQVDDERPDGSARKPGPEGLRHLLKMAAEAVLPHGERPAGMSKKVARGRMSDYIAELGHRRPDNKTYRRHGY
jgi:hypothetical protein